MSYILSREEAGEFDRFAAERCNVPAIILMENAGKNAFHIIASLVDQIHHALVVCGSGNNGGDGFVVARHLHCAGVSVTVCILADVTRLSGNALINYSAYAGIGGKMIIVNDDVGLINFDTELANTDLVIDAIFGTGLIRDVAGIHAQAITRINASPARVISLDIPSGLESNTGVILGECIAANATITFAAPKLGLVTPNGDRMAGTIIVASLGVPEQIIQRTGHSAQLFTGRLVRELTRYVHYDSDGAVAIAISDERDIWALRLAALAVTRTAPGRIKVLAPMSILRSVPEMASVASLVELDPRGNAGDAGWASDIALKLALEIALRDCGSIVFPAASESDIQTINHARTLPDTTVIAAATSSLGKKIKGLHSTAAEAVFIVGIEALAGLCESGVKAVADNRFAAIRDGVRASNATIVLADARGTVGASGLPLGVFSRNIDALDCDGARAIVCGATARMACWCPQSHIAAIAGMFTVCAAAEAWSETRGGRGGPRPEDIADEIPRVLSSLSITPLPRIPFTQERRTNQTDDHNE